MQARRHAPCPTKFRPGGKRHNIDSRPCAVNSAGNIDPLAGRGGIWSGDPALIVRGWGKERSRSAQGRPSRDDVIPRANESRKRVINRYRRQNQPPAGQSRWAATPVSPVYAFTLDRCRARDRPATARVRACGALMFGRLKYGIIGRVAKDVQQKIKIDDVDDATNVLLQRSTGRRRPVYRSQKYQTTSKTRLSR